MSVVAKTKSQLPVIIDIDGPEGNAFVLMGYASSTMRKSRFAEETKESVLNEMQSGDYINLLKVFDRYFGSVFTLQTSNPEYLDAFMIEKGAQ
tara:strand:- start:1041 stop:1319 length:279 start_codon:yes stop_codon:yes gene_type:complete